MNSLKQEFLPPFGESSSHIKLSRHRINKRMEDWDVKHQFLIHEEQMGKYQIITQT